jgi:hypothetical protein
MLIPCKSWKTTQVDFSSEKNYRNWLITAAYSSVERRTTEKEGRREKSMTRMRKKSDNNLLSLLHILLSASSMASVLW